MDREAYLRGRMEGLFQLVSLLKELMSEGEGNEAIEKRLVEHIYNEMVHILEQMGEEKIVDKEKVEEVKKKVEVAKAEKKSPKEHVDHSYDLLSELVKGE